MNQQQTWNLSNYEGPGIINRDDDGKIVSITMTVEQEKEHDAQYRQRLIDMGLLVPAPQKKSKKKNV